jgi:hypothetical protein
MAYFENGGMLDLHLKEWEHYTDKDRWRIILVDDCSKRDPALPHIRDVGIEIELYRINTDRAWNQNGARNLGMTHASGWCLLTDMDHLLLARDAKRLQRIDLDGGPARYYRPHRILAATSQHYKPHPNTWIIRALDYWHAGGYDERYCGYYGTDWTLRKALENAFGPAGDIDVDLWLYQREVQPDASTTDYGRKGSEYHLRSLPCKGASLKPVPMLNFEWERVSDHYRRTPA